MEPLDLASRRTVTKIRIVACYFLRACPSAPIIVRSRLLQAGEAPLLTEDQVQRSFRNLFKTKDFPLENFDKAENLLDELRAESPLRHRLSVELEELRKMHTAKAR